MKYLKTQYIFLKQVFKILYLIAAAAILLLPVTSCSLFDQYYVEKETYDSAVKLYQESEKKYDELKTKYENQQDKYLDLISRKADLEKEIEKLKKTLDESQNEAAALSEELESLYRESGTGELAKRVARLENLLDSINGLLQYSYIGSAYPEELAYTFTAFSLNYNNKYYIVTAGHCVQDNYGEEGKFKFRANFSGEWIYPELIKFEPYFYKLQDYAVFGGENIKGGFKAAAAETETNYLVGSMEKGLSVFRNLGDSSKRGESGSPVINENGRVEGIYVVYGLVYTPIELVLDAIDEYG